MKSGGGAAAERERRTVCCLLHMGKSFAQLLVSARRIQVDDLECAVVDVGVCVCNGRDIRSRLFCVGLAGRRIFECASDRKALSAQGSQPISHARPAPALCPFTVQCSTPP